jgi:hypothetical protein
MIHHLRHRGTRSRASSGALAAVLVRSTDVCLSPDSGGIADIPQPPLRATFGLMRRGNNALFDHLVGNRKQSGRERQANRFGSLLVDDQVELGRLVDRQVGRLAPIENATGIDTGLPGWRRTPPVADSLIVPQPQERSG